MGVPFDKLEDSLPEPDLDPELDEVEGGGRDDDVETDYELSQELERRRRDGSLIRLKARMIVETEGLPRLYAMLGDTSIKPADRLEAMKILARLGALDSAREGGGESGPQMVVHFNIPTPENPKPLTDVVLTHAQPVPAISGPSEEWE